MDNNEKVLMDFRREVVAPALCGDDGITQIEIEKDILFSWFKENILESFRSDDDSVSDEGLLEEWLLEYSSDDTCSLYDYWKAAHENDIKTKEEYVAIYNKAFNELLAKWQNEPSCTDPYYNANMEFNDAPSADEIVGYYIERYRDDAYSYWMDNLWTDDYKKDARASFREQDEEVTRILESLYKMITVREIRWYIPEGQPVNPKLSENKLIPAPEDESADYGDYIAEYLKDKYGTDVTSFRYFYKGNEKECHNYIDKGVGCYGVGSYACLNHCTGCDDKTKENAIREINEQKQMEYESERNSRFSTVPENTKESVDWIMGFSGSEMDDVETFIVKGTKEQVKKYLLDRVLCDCENEETDNYENGAKSLDDISEDEDGTLSARLEMSDYHNDYTARPVSSARHLDLDTILLKIGY